MRIVGGTFRGRQFNPPKNFNARPTTDFAKESLFNIINNNFYFDELNVLDLFSGTGSISFEFISREVTHVDAVEADFVHCKFIKDTALKLEIKNLMVFKANAFSFIGRCTSRYDIIFSDPPYDLKGIDQIPEIVLSRGLLNDNGWLVLEHSARYNFKDNPSLFDHRVYGSVNFSFFKK
ncbi:MAG: RsmD family RNA methyltransferase [Bacteroidales bacterium]